MAQHEIDVKVNLDDSEARRKIDKLTKEKRKVKVDVDSSNLDKSVSGLKDKNIKVNTKVNGTKDVNNLTSGLSNARKASDSLGSSLKGMAKFGAQLAIFRMIREGAREAVQAVKEIDSEIVNLQVATGKSYTEIKQMVSGYASMAKDMGATMQEIASGSDLFLRSGKTLEETNKLLKESTILSKVSKLDPEESSKVYLATLNGFQLAADQASHVSDVLTKLDMETASSAGGIGTSLTKTASMANKAGVSLEKTASIIATMKDVTQDSDQSVGNAVKSMLSRMNQIKAGKFVDEETGEALNDTEKVLNELGVSMRDVNGQFLDSEIILDNVGAKWETLDKKSKRAMSTALGGTYQYNKLIATFDNWSKVEKLTDMAKNSDGVALEKFNDAYLDSIEAKQKSLIASFQSLAVNTISRDTYAGVVEATQALVEFLDKTQLLKGALAGLAVGGVMKGFSLMASGITQTMIKMQNFQKALVLLKSGNIGADGIQRLAMYTDGLSKSQLKAVLSSNQLTAAQRMQILTASGMSESTASATLATMGLSAAEGTATTSTISLGTAMKGLMSTMLSNPIFLVMTAVTAGVSAWSAYKNAIEEANNEARESAQSFSENNNSLNEQIAKVRELKSALSSGTLSDNEEISAKQQLLDIQNQLIDTYGQQAQGIDLVNGSLEKELSLMSQLNVQDANKYLNENKSAIDRATSAMEKQRHAYLGQVTPGSTDTDELQKIINKYKDDGIYTDTDTSTGAFTIHFKGDATQAEETLNSFMNDVRTLSDKNGDEYGILNGIADNASAELKDVQGVLDEYQEIYNTALQSDMVSKGFGEGKPATVLNEYTEAIDAYNDALANGDASAIEKAKTSFDEVQGSVNDVLSQYPEYQSLFDEVGNTLNDTAIKAKDFQDALNGDGFKDIISQFKDLQDVDLKGISFSDDINADGEEALKSVVDKAIELGIVSDDSAESVSTVVDLLVEMGLTGSQSVESLSNSFEVANTSIQNATANAKTLKEIMAGSMSGEGISADSVKAFREMFGDNAELALEKTANGYHLNEKALAQLQKQQEAMTKGDYLGALADQQEALRRIDEQIAKAQFMGEDISGLQAQRSGIENQIDILQDLQLQYEAATSAYQQWQSAMSGFEEGDMYDSIFEEQEKAKELYDKGLTGTNEFKTFTDLLSSEDLSDASVEQIVAAYERLGNTIQGTTHNAMEFSTEGQEGCIAFLDAVSQLNTDWAHMNEDGSWDINFGTNDKEVADALGIDVEYLQSILRKLSDYGFDIDLNKPVASLEELKSSAQSAKESLEGMGDTELSGINLDSSSFSEITGNIDNVRDYIESINESDLEPNVKTEKLEYANAVLEYLVGKQEEAGNQEIEISVNAEELESKIEDAKSSLEDLKNEDGVIPINAETQGAIDNMQSLLYQKEQLEAPAIMNVDASQVEGDLGTAIAKVQEYQSALQTLNVQSELKAQGVDIDTSGAQAKVDSLEAEIQAINPEITAKLGIDTSSTANLQTSISNVTPEILVKAGVQDSAITGYQAPEKESTVKYKVDASSVNSWKAPNKSGKVTYTAIWNISNPPTKTQYVNIVETKKATGTMLSMKSHASGTLSAHSNGRVALPHDERALVNELGMESRIRNGVWEPILGGMHVENLKKGDIIINAEQTEQLIKHGKVSGGSMSAYSSGTGKFNISNSGSKAYSSSVPKASSNTSQAAQEATKATEDLFDFVEIYLERAKEATEKATDLIDDAVGLAGKMSANTTALTKIQAEIVANQQASAKYMAQANAVGLSENYASQIRSGSLNIENITDENLKKQIDEYQKWYETSKKASDAVTELQREERELAVERLSYIEDVYEAVTKVHESIQEINESQLDLEELQGFSGVSDAVRKVLQSSIDEQQKIYEQNLQRLTDYESEFNSLVSNGYLKEGSDEYLEAQAQLNEFKKEVNESASELIEFQDKLREVEYTKIQYIIDGLERATSKIDKWIELQESRDEKVPESVYQEQIDNNNASIKENYNLRNEKLKEQALYDVNSKRYQELADEINKVSEETLGLMTDTQKLKDEIFELRFTPLDEAIEKYDKLSNEIGDFYDLLNEDAFFTKEGGGTAELAAGLALLAQQLEVNKQKIADYKVGLDKLQQSFKNGVISEEEFNEKSEEYVNGIQESAKANNDLSESITDLYLKQLKTENEYLQTSIDKHKELLQQRKENDEYSRKVKSQTKDINVLKAQISALSGTTNASAQAELKRLNAQLKEAEDELNQTRKDHQYDVRQEGYDSMSESLDEIYENTEYALIHSAEKQQSVIQQMLNNIVNNYADAYGKINEIIGNTGWTGSSDFNNNQNELNSSSGANNQVNNATQKPSNTRPSDSATGTVTDPINDNSKENADIEHDIMQKPNTDNRPVAELTLSTSSVTLEEGKQATVKTQIRPTDAKNKILSWTSSNESVATASDGTIHAKKPGTCIVTVSTTDGSGISHTITVTVTKKPDPPKPNPPANNNNQGGGDGVPRVGDIVTFDGSYYYDSWGMRPSGNMFSGVPGGVKINSYSSSKYGGQSGFHGDYDVSLSSADGRYQLGWVKLSQIKGYKTGTKGVPEDQLAFTHDNEIIIRKSDGGVLRQMGKGDAVFTSDASDSLMTLVKNERAIMNAANLGLTLPTSIPDIGTKDVVTNVTNHYDSLLTVNGNVDKEALPGLEEILERAYKNTSKRMYKDAGLMGIHKRI